MSDFCIRDVYNVSTMSISNTVSEMPLQCPSLDNEIGNNIIIRFNDSLVHHNSIDQLDPLLIDLNY